MAAEKKMLKTLEAQEAAAEKKRQASKSAWQGSKNYYKPNKQYFSRDECALVRVLFYFVELLC